MSGKIYSIHTQPPPLPATYPVTLDYVDWHSKKTVTLQNEEQYYAWVFWNWQCKAEGFSNLHPTLKDSDGGALEVGNGV